MKHQLAYKPGSVSKQGMPCSPGSHSSRRDVTITLMQPTRAVCYANQPRYLIPHAAPIRSCFRWGLPCLDHYWSSGGLLPHPFTLTYLKSLLKKRPSKNRRFPFCGTFPKVALAGRYPAPFCVKPGLSSPIAFQLLIGAAA